MSVPSSSRARASSLSGGGGGGERRVRTTSTAGGSSGHGQGDRHGHGQDPLASSSAASSQIVGGSAQPSRADQIVYRFYLKTVGVLVDGRVTHFSKGERKKDRWFNLSIPDTEVHKADLSIYRLVSEYPPLPSPPPGESSSRSTVPPLLIAFILDTNDIPAGQTLTWNRDGQRVALDPCLVHSPAHGARKPGVVLERWTFRVTDVADAVPGGSEMAPPTAYRLGIVHFRALYAFIRLLPAYRLFRRLRRLNTGLRLGIKLWGPEGYPNTAAGLAEAWEVMERDLVGIDVPLERMIPSQQEKDKEAAGMGDAGEPLLDYTFAPLELFGSTYELSVSYRRNTDFDVEDMESLLSEKFVDMDEDWFTPTVARHRLQSEARAAASAGTSVSSQRTTNAPGVAGTPPRLQPVVTGTSARASAAPSRTSGSIPKEPSSLGAGKWSALTEGLPFASGSQIVSGESGSPVAPSPTGATASAIPYRRLSAHSLQPFRSISASPSTSILRAPGAVPFPGSASTARATASPLPGSLPRTSEFLSSSGRSFTHAQMANMMAGHGTPSSAPSGPSNLGASPPFAPSSLSFTKQAVRPSGMVNSTSSPFIPSSLDREPPSHSPGSLPKRYSASSFTQRRLTGSSGSSGDGALPASLLRRQSTQSGLRHSIDEPRADTTPSAPRTETRPDARDNDDVHAFLRALDSWTPPASIAPHSVSPRATTSVPAVTTTAATPVQASNTSSTSTNSHPSPRVSSTGSAQASSVSLNRAPLTRQHVDDMLKRMAGSFSAGEPGSGPGSGVGSPIPVPSALPSSSHSPVPSAVPSRPSSSHLVSRRESIVSERSAATSGPGLLSASRPSPPPAGISPRSNASPLPASSLRHGSFPRSGALPFAVPAHLSSTSTAAAVGAARSLPAQPAGTEGADAAPGALRALSPPEGVLSPQTTGGLDTSSRRRGPVLVRGGFGAASSKASASSSPSHSPVRDYMRPYRAHERDESVGSNSGMRRSSTLTSVGQGHGHAHGIGARVGRTAPSSLGADVSEDSELENALATGGRVDTRGRYGTYVSEASTSPSTSDRSRSQPRSSPVEGLMARLALAERGERKKDDGAYPYGP